MFRPRPPSQFQVAIQRFGTIPVTGRAGIDPATSPYYFPNIPEECKRLDLQHYILRGMLKSNIVAPIGDQQAIHDRSNSGTWTNFVLGMYQRTHTLTRLREPRRILDIGSGTGRWAIDLARQFPRAEVIGMDIVSPARPYTDASPQPANYHFQLANALNPMPFPEASFDYVHLRFMGMSIPGDRWLAVIREAARITAPGGWIESLENGLPINGGPAIAQFTAAIEQAGKARGADPACVRLIESFMRQADSPLRRIQSQMIEIPIGPQSGSIGLQWAWNFTSLVQHLGGFFQSSGLFSQAEWALLLQDIDHELHDAVASLVFPLYLTIGQRSLI